MPSVNVEKGTERKTNCGNTKGEMVADITAFFSYLSQSSQQFDEKIAYKKLLSYIKKNDRILYSEISNIIYTYAGKGKDSPTLGIVMNNLEKIVNYAQQIENIEGETKENIEKARISAWKILDHVSLASQQYTMLKQTDKEYDEKFKTRISTFKNELMKEMNAQLLTMVGIFTALAFLIFGSISSLDGIFENNGIPILKMITIGIIWGLCVLNMIFVFLFLVEKLIRFDGKAGEDSSPVKQSVFKEYPIVKDANAILIILFVIILWVDFIDSTSLRNYIHNYCDNHPICALVISLLVVVLIIFIWIFQKRKSKKTPIA